MEIKYDEKLGHIIEVGDFLIFFSNKFTDLNTLKHNKKINIKGFEVVIESLIMAEQAHSKKAVIVNKEMKGSGFIKPEIAKVDALITNRSDIGLVVKTADCVPVILLHCEKNVMATIHSGREGTRQNVVGEIVTKIIKHYNVDSNEIHVFIGPAIRPNNYEVDEKKFYEFVDSTGIVQEYRNLDLKKVIINQLLSLGISQENIININEGTLENSCYHSYRRNKTAERQVSIILKKR